jgi:chromosome partitioning protein
VKTIVFCNNKGGVGKTLLTYHLAWMYADLGVPVLAVDLDPQSNLSAMFVQEPRLEELWPEGPHPDTVLGVVEPILRATGDIAPPHVERVEEGVGLLVGDMGLSRFEDKLSENWPKCSDGDEAAFRVTTAFHRMMKQAADAVHARLVLVDIGPNLGAINRAAMISARYVVTPLAPDLFSMQGLRNLGPTLRRWRAEWGRRRDEWSRLGDERQAADLSLPDGQMEPMGYVVMQHAVRLDRPVKAYARWMRRIPGEYAAHVLGEDASGAGGPDDDDRCLAQLKHYRSLMPLAMEARKPMFSLRPADGAIGAHQDSVRACRRDFHQLGELIAGRCGVKVG